VRKCILYWSRGVPALNMKIWIEHSLRQQIRVYAANTVTRHISEEICAAPFAPGTRSSSQSEDIGLSAHY
jgi:hypothetical protein